MSAGYELSEDERDLMDHVHGLFAGEDEDEVFGEDEATEDAPEVDDGCPFEADAIDGEHLDDLAIARCWNSCREGAALPPGPPPWVGRLPSLPSNS